MIPEYHVKHFLCFSYSLSEIHSVDKMIIIMLHSLLLLLLLLLYMHTFKRDGSMSRGASDLSQSQSW